MSRIVSKHIHCMGRAYPDIQEKILSSSASKCPGCGEQATVMFIPLERRTSAMRVCKCGHEFWEKYSRYDILKD